MKRLNISFNETTLEQIELLKESMNDNLSSIIRRLIHEQYKKSIKGK